MSRRLLTPWGGFGLFVLVSLLVAGSLAWVTVTALQVETAERTATARAKFATQERLALWQLDSRLFPSLSVENARPYAQYFTLYVPHIVAFDAEGNPNLPSRVPSPLLSAELPPWMLLHFQLDPETGWQSPQVVSATLAEKLAKPQRDRQSFANFTTPRQELLKELREKFEPLQIHAVWANQRRADTSDGVFGVPWVYSENSTNTMNVPGGGFPFLQRGNDFSRKANPNSLNEPADAGPGGNSLAPPSPQVAQTPAEYQGADARFRSPAQENLDLNARRGVFTKGAKETQNAGERYPPMPPPAPSIVPPAPAPAHAPASAAKSAARGAPSRAGPPPPAAPPVEQEAVNPPEKRKDEPLVRLQAAGRPGPTPTALPELHPLAFGTDGTAGKTLQPPAVHVGPIRPEWLVSEDGGLYLMLVRMARLETKTVFQGVVLDWPRLRNVLLEEIHGTLPGATLEPVHEGEELNERQMATIPVKLVPGAVPEPPSAGWTPLRLGLVLGWAAALFALGGVGFAGWSLIDLSERRIRFVSAVTHELRTPLTSMRLYLDLLTSGMIADEEKQREYLRTLHGESDRLNQLIENVLDFARLEKRTVRTHKVPTKVDEIMTQARQTWFDRCVAEGKELIVISTVPLDQQVNTDPRIVGQVLSNLIDNARKYSACATDPRLWVWAKPGEGRRIVFEVEDRGPGVPLPERASIFHPFRRGQTADTTAGGAGLGLALAKQWADMLGGSLHYRPAEGGTGACFRLELPAIGNGTRTQADHS